MGWSQVSPLPPGTCAFIYVAIINRVQHSHFFQLIYARPLYKFIIIVDGGNRTHDPKTHGLSTTPFVKILVGY